ncbi:GGDEF domain-containing protein [Candidatus Uhrbacteria bacterium]|nr:GGDEF domain-containing protein [Candidatus Uhrbacteria bacterium]
MLAWKHYRLSIENIELKHNMMHDFMTGLANRRWLETNFDRRRLRWGRNGNPILVMVIDVNNFKSVNDNHGHDEGDAIIRFISSKILEALRPEDIVVRPNEGGDEFWVVLSAPNAQILHTIIRRVLDDAWCRVDSELRVTISAGCTLLGEHEALQLAIKRADGLLFHAKEESHETDKASVRYDFETPLRVVD